MKALNDKNFHSDLEVLNNISPEYFSDFITRLKAHSNYNKLKKKFIIDYEKKTIIHILEQIPIKEFEDLNDEEAPFYPLCSKEEIKKIFFPKKSVDYLLKLRAENIINTMRLHRLFISIRKKNSDWLLSEYINTTHFEEYLSYTSETINKKCLNIPHGLIHINETNGFCQDTPYGNIIVISEALKYFLYYMNLFVLGRQLGVSEEDTTASFWIGIRTMLGTEPLDFELDSRGEIPEKIEKQIQISTNWQLRFIAGHEYAHHYLGHLNKSNIKTVSKLNNNGKEENLSIYSYSHQNEYDADFNSINSVLNKDYKDSLAVGAFYFFFFLDLFDTVVDYMNPKSNNSIGSHPNPVDRIWKLNESLNDEVGIKRNDMETFINSFNPFKKSIIENTLPFKVDEIESYTSTYLPGYKKDFKYDRLDY
jgi:hypothetical protein